MAWFPPHPSSFPLPRPLRAPFASTPSQSGDQGGLRRIADRRITSDQFWFMSSTSSARNTESAAHGSDPIRGRSSTSSSDRKRLVGVIAQHRRSTVGSQWTARVHACVWISSRIARRCLTCWLSSWTLRRRADLRASPDGQLRTTRGWGDDWGSVRCCCCCCCRQQRFFSLYMTVGPSL